MVSLNVENIRTLLLLTSVISLAIYVAFFDSPEVTLGQFEDFEELEEEIESANPVHVVSYKSPIDENLFIPWEGGGGVSRAEYSYLYNKNDEPLDYAYVCKNRKENPERNAKFSRLWRKVDEWITEKNGLWPRDEDKNEALSALKYACILNIDILDRGEKESGSGHKWIATLEGGQKVIIKLLWEPKGEMKTSGLCNEGYEMPSSEIAAFQLHEILGFRNTPYVVGRKLDLYNDILQNASPIVAKQFILKKNNETCVRGRCPKCRNLNRMCPRNNMVSASVMYWVSRNIKSYTPVDSFMPFSLYKKAEWNLFGFNDKRYCDKIRREVEPYRTEKYYLDLFDFAILDYIMFNYDSRHYVIADGTEADGLTVRLDHGRAFCDYTRDANDIFLAPLNQCCMLRKSTYAKLKSLKNGQLSGTLRKSLSSDALKPVLRETWFHVLDRRMESVLDAIELCFNPNQMKNVLI